MKLKKDEDERTLRETVDRCYKQGKCKGKMKLNEMKNNRQKQQTKETDGNKREEGGSTRFRKAISSLLYLLISNEGREVLMT